MAYYGVRKLESEKKADMMKLAEAIKRFQDTYTSGVERETKRDKKRKFHWGLRSMLDPIGAILGDKAIYESRTEGYDSPKLLEKIFPKLAGKIEKDLSPIDYGDPSELEEYETMFTRGMAGEEADTLGEMISDRDVPWWEVFLGERKQDAEMALKLLPFVTGAPVTGGGTNILPQAREGGYVSPKKYYGGGSVTGNPTITDYFSRQGKTLSGSNRQSLAERLGRK